VLKEHNWTLKADIVDDGGYFCPERQRATALKIAKEIKPFAALGTSGSAQGPILADVVTRAGIIHAGINWQTTAAERARHPYGWNLFAHPDKKMRFAVDWMERRIKGTTVPDRSVPNQPPQVKRVYGILGLDEQGGRELAKTTNDAMVAAGLPVKGVYFTSPSGGVAAQQAPATVAKMRDDGVNTLVWATNFGDGKDFFVAFTNAMDQQNYLPDIIGGTIGAAFFEQLANRRVWANAKGTSGYLPITLRTAVDANGPVEEYNNINENSSAFIEAWQEKLGNNDEPGDQAYPGAFDTWAQLSILATGIIHAGPVLNAQTWARGVQSAGSPGSPNRCTVARFMGRDYKHAPSYTWNAEHDGGLKGYTPVYWVNKQTALGTNGLYESYDNYLYFKSGKDIPAKPTRDTGKQGTDIKKQERVGIKAWKSCKEFPNFPRG
jgi:hypothetical protein